MRRSYGVSFSATYRDLNSSSSSSSSSIECRSIRRVVCAAQYHVIFRLRLTIPSGNYSYKNWIRQST